MVLDGAGMQGRAVANGHIIPNDAGIAVCHMETAVVLNVGVAADFNAVYVAPHRAVGPYAGELFHFYHTDYIRAFKYVSLRINIRADSFKFS